MASIINVDQIKNAAGTSGLTLDSSTGKASFPSGATLPAGSVLQVITEKTNANLGTTSTSFVDSNLSCTITPSSTSSKILCIVSSPSWYVANNASYITIYRGSTDLGNSTYGLMRNDNTASNSAGATNQVLDSPNTTSATEYSVYYRTSNGDQCYICYSSYGYLTLTVMEIAQ